MTVSHVIFNIGPRALLPTDTLPIKGGRGETIGVARGQLQPSGVIAVIVESDQLPPGTVGIKPVVATSTNAEGVERPALISVKLTQSGAGEGVRVLRPGLPGIPIPPPPRTILDR